jgi:hypothetical protein
MSMSAQSAAGAREGVTADMHAEWAVAAASAWLVVMGRPTTISWPCYAVHAAASLPGRPLLGRSTTTLPCCACCHPPWCARHDFMRLMTDLGRTIGVPVPEDPQHLRAAALRAFK